MGVASTFRSLVPAFVLLVAVAACTSKEDLIDEIRGRGELRLITRNGPTTYFVDGDGEQGFDYELARDLASELGVTLSVRQAFTLEEMFAALERGEADIAGAGLTLTEARASRFPISISYARQRPQVIYKAGEARPRNLRDLARRHLLVIAGSSHEALLKGIAARGVSDLTWEAVPSSDPFELLTRVLEGKADAALIDSRDFLVQQNLLPGLSVAFDLTTERSIVWYLTPRAQDSRLLATVNAFLEARLTDGAIADLRQRYFEKDEAISRIDTQTFIRRMRDDLREYQQLIELVAREEDLPWELLAAMSYQESHWDPTATSRTGVRGMMMLTLATAEDLGVEDRTDPAESVRGGARYFKQLLRRLPDDIEEPDRTWLALASYNIGMGHLEDARVLTERRGGDPHLWVDVMESLPLLENPRVYPDLRYGYARGREAVRYVQNIRHYRQVLRLQSARDTAPSPPRDPRDLLPPGLRNLRLLAL